MAQFERIDSCNTHDMHPLAPAGYAFNCRMNRGNRNRLVASNLLVQYFESAAGKEML